MAWPKFTSAIVIAATLVAAMGTATAIYEKIWADPYAESSGLLETAPPTIIIRPSHFKPGEYPSGGNVGIQSGKWVATSVPMTWLLGASYSSIHDRMVLPPDLPKGTYDLMLTLPDHQMNALRNEIKRRFGLTAKKEERETDVMLLKIKDAEKLQTHATKNGEMVLEQGREVSRMFDLGMELELLFETPVIDRTGSTSHYNFNYDFRDKFSLSAEAKMKYLHDHLLGPFGLDLVPGRERITMLVVEKAQDHK